MFFLFSISRGAIGILIGTLMFAIGLSSWAADPLSMADAQRIAVGRSQQLFALDALATAAGEQAVSAGQLPDPVLKLGIDNLPVNGPDQYLPVLDFVTRRIGVAQDLPSAQKRALRRERFERSAKRVLAQRQLSMANVQRDTALAWLDRYYSQATRALLAQQIDEAQLQVQAAEVAFRSGRGSQADVFAARAAAIGLEDRLSEIDRQFRSAGLLLTRWVGADVAQRTLTGVPPWQSTPVEADISSAHLQQYPDLQVIGAEREAAVTEVRLAQANKESDWSVEVSYSQRGPTYSDMLFFGVSIPLQWDRKNRQDREVAAAVAMVDESTARYEDAMRVREADFRNRLNDWQSGKERVARYRDSLIPTTQQRTVAALTSYSTGKSDLSAVLNARREEIDVQIQALALERDTARAWAQLKFLIPDQGTSAQTKDKP
jgi:outer membrane protein TolC